jgi:hypothetical protein
MKIFKVIPIICFAILFSSCSSYQSIRNGAYSDISLNRNSNEYELKRLAPVEAEGDAFFGIPIKTKKKQGVIVRFNGVQLGRSQQIFPILTMILYSTVVGSVINEIGGSKYDSDTYEEKNNIGLLPSIAIAIPIAGIINNLTWSDSALQNASWNMNSTLLEENPDVDLFINPKYEIENNLKIFTQKAKLKATVMGAIIKTN